MKIFIDSADLDEITQAYKWGIADGVTTNPSLLKKAVDKREAMGETVNVRDYLKKLLRVAKGTPVSLEVTESEAEGMIEQGKALYKDFNPIAKNVYIKIPVNPAFKEEDDTQFDGLKAIKELSSIGIPINCTLVFTPEQALLAAKAGASFVSPFAGRVDDYIRAQSKKKFDKKAYFPAGGVGKDDNGIVSGIDLVAKCVNILNYYDFETEVLAASLRNPRQVREAALVGAEIATLPFGVIQDMLKHFKTYEGMAKFTADIVPEYVDLCEACMKKPKG